MAQPWHYNLKKTHCPQGHEYSPENTYYYATQYRTHIKRSRQCKLCTKLRNKAHYNKLFRVQLELPIGVYE